MKRTRNINETRKVRAPKLHRKDKLIRRYDADGWEVSIYQRPSGDYLVSAFQIDGDDWRVESGSTIKDALAGFREADADVEKLLEVEELSTPC